MGIREREESTLSCRLMGGPFTEIWGRGGGVYLQQGRRRLKSLVEHIKFDMV